MDFVNLIITLAPSLWDCSANCISLFCGLQKNVESLGRLERRLDARSQDVERRVEFLERQQLTARQEVKDWLDEVRKEQKNVGAIVQEADILLEMQCCLGSCRNFWPKYNLGKRVAEISTRVKELMDRGNFENVADEVLSRVVLQSPPHWPIVGFDSLYERVCSCFGESEVGIVGLYGVRGVGKTTLLKEINNNFLTLCLDFDVVIWVTVSNQASMNDVQEAIGHRLHCNGSMSQNRSQGERTTEIFNIMRTIRFVLLLDNVCQQLDLSEIGIPPPAANRSKVIFTTRSLKICSEMQAQRRFQVKCLPSREASNLFTLMVGEDTLSSQPDIRNLAHSVIERCKGLPLALVTVGRALAGKKTLEEWEQAMQG